jgi:ribosomal protein L34
MTGKPVVVHAQWALHGQPPGTDGQRVLACSTGDLSAANFTDAIGRFQLGQLDNLPQVSVSYLLPAGQPDGSYLALTIHRKTDTRYFCVPYRPLAAGAVTYHAMYQAVRGIPLPQDDRRPLRVEISRGAHGPTLDPLAMRVAALLLTGTPVCVLNAEDTTVDDRLAFIDWVMALLPYGFRSRMAAATWTRPTFRDHKFRLCFSAAPRQGDHAVHWGEPDRAVLPEGPVRDYFGRLEKSASQLTRLANPAEDGSDLKFDAAAAVRALELIGTPAPAGPPRAAFSRSPDSLNAVELIALVGREGYDRPQHFRTVCDAILRRLKESPRSYRPHDLRRALREHGFLAGVLQANESADEEYQVRALHEFLLAAYPTGLGKPAILRILTGTGSTPTPALLAAVSLCLSSPEDVELAQQAYIHGSITRMSLDASTYVRLAPYVPDVSRASADVEATEP